MSWPLVKLGEIFDITSSKRVHEKDWRSEGVPFYRAREVAVLSKEGKVDNDLFIDESMYEEFRIKYGVPKEGDLLITAVGTLGKVYAVQARDRFYFKDASVIWLRKKRDVDTSYIRHVLNSVEVQRFIQNSSGATVGAYTIGRANETEIPLPPLEEQKRISAILDKAAAIRHKRQQAIKLADDFLRSVFLEMFGDPVTNPKGWKPATLGDLIFFAKDGPHVSPTYSEKGIPFLSTRHVKPSGVIWEDLKYVTQEEADVHWKKCKPERGDILYTKGGTTGVACPVDFEKDFAVWVHVALLRPNKSEVNYIWLAQMLNSKYCYDQSQKHTRGATNKDLGLKRMVEIEMFCPPIAEQNKFVEIKNRIGNFVKRSESFNQSQLFESLSRKAFSGQL